MFPTWRVSSAQSSMKQTKMKIAARIAPRRSPRPRRRFRRASRQPPTSSTVKTDAVKSSAVMNSEAGSARRHAGRLAPRPDELEVHRPAVLRGRFDAQRAIGALGLLFGPGRPGARVEGREELRLGGREGRAIQPGFGQESLPVRQPVGGRRGGCRGRRRLEADQTAQGVELDADHSRHRRRRIALRDVSRAGAVAAESLRDERDRTLPVPEVNRRRTPVFDVLPTGLRFVVLFDPDPVIPARPRSPRRSRAASRCSRASGGSPSTVRRGLRAASRAARARGGMPAARDRRPGPFRRGSDPRQAHAAPGFMPSVAARRRDHLGRGRLAGRDGRGQGSPPGSAAATAAAERGLCAGPSPGIAG